jgi:hypothetical protein
MTKQGIGCKLVGEAENFVREKADVYFASLVKWPERRIVLMEMGVVNVRHDLFPWYQKQGYEVVEEIRDDADFNLIVAEGLSVFCILMRKVLQQA